MAEPTAGQIALLIASVALFAAGWGLSLARLRRDREGFRVAAKACMYGGLLVGLAVLVWHSAGRGNWLPLTDNFDTLVWLGLLLALFVLYTQRTRPLRGLDWFVSPIVILLLVGAAVFGRTNPHEYDLRSVWLWTHRVAAYGGAVGFAVAGAVGAMYLMVNHRLRAKTALPAAAGAGPAFGSLERLEHLTLAAVTLGFSLLTIGTVTGVVRYMEEGGRTPAAKIVLAVAVWLVYAVVLHSPINPSFRGKKAAVLSVIGFVLMVGTIVAVQFA
jgi:ABC-type transport system involved in cytochrome c biogenesis permease subunit